MLNNSDFVLKNWQQFIKQTKCLFVSTLIPWSSYDQKNTDKRREIHFFLSTNFFILHHYDFLHSFFTFVLSIIWTDNLICLFVCLTIYWNEKGFLICYNVDLMIIISYFCRFKNKIYRISHTGCYFRFAVGRKNYFEIWVHFSLYLNMSRYL